MREVNPETASELVSVVIPTLGNLEKLRRAISSIIMQDYPHKEVVVVDDGDEDLAIELNRFSELLAIKYFRNVPRLGFIESLKFGVEQADGKYVARIDSDDYWIDERKLSSQIAEFKADRELVLVGTNFIVSNERETFYRRKMPQKEPHIRMMVLLGNPFCHSTVMFRKSAYYVAGGYRTMPSDFHEDWDLWLRMGMIGKLRNLPSYTSVYTAPLEARTARVNWLVGQERAIELRSKYKKEYPFYGLALAVGEIYRACFLVLSPGVIERLRRAKRLLL